MSSSSDDDDDYAYGDSNAIESKRFPVHDCCEFEDAEALRVSEIKDFRVKKIATMLVVVEGSS